MKDNFELHHKLEIVVIDPQFGSLKGIATNVMLDSHVAKYKKMGGKLPSTPERNLAEYIPYTPVYHLDPLHRTTTQ